MRKSKLKNEKNNGKKIDETLDFKHEEFLNEFYSDEKNLLPELMKKRENLKNDFNDENKTFEQLLDIKNSIRKKDVHFPPSRLVCLENTHNRCFGMPLDINYINKVSEIVKNNSMMLHVDGARIFNAAAALNKSVAELTSEVDSVSFCLS